MSADSWEPVSEPEPDPEPEPGPRKLADDFTAAVAADEAGESPVDGRESAEEVDVDPGPPVVEGFDGNAPLPEEQQGLRGPELARAALEAAKSGRIAKAAKRQRAKSTKDYDGVPRRRGYSGSGADSRDPQPLGALVDRLFRARQWQEPAARASVLGDWERIVGPDIAAHCVPVRIRDTELLLQAESTAWATQLRFLAPKLLARIQAEVGAAVVRRISVHGPAAPSWRHGPRSSPGRGPRDTYG